GTLEITSYDPASGEVVYNYYVDGAQDHSDGAVSDDIEIVVIDALGRTTSDTLGVEILDTEPEAKDDTALITEDDVAPIIGDVLANDTLGMDNPHTVEFADTTAQYGTFTVDAEGKW